MNGKIAVVGATGRVGGHVADLLAAEGREVARIAKSEGVDVVTGAGLDEAVRGAAVIVDVATGRSADEREATDFFTAAAANLQAAGARAGVRRIVLVSIIGVDRYSAGYGLAKRRHELATLGGPVPARVLRAAQFHEFVPQLMEWGRQGDVTYVPRMRTQVVAAATVAGRVVELALDPADAGDGAITEIAGPREERLAALARLFADVAGIPGEIQEIENEETALSDAGGLLPGPGATLAGPTFAEWVQATFGGGEGAAAAAAVRARLDSARS
jgi:uncharacterized protein YbjT (DUF2867 family)